MQKLQNDLILPLLIWLICSPLLAQENEIDRMHLNLASKNSVPRMSAEVEGTRVHPPGDFEQSEQLRVADNINEIVLKQTELCWKVLIEKVHDESYAISLTYNVIGESNYSVGEVSQILCREFVRAGYADAEEKFGTIVSDDGRRKSVAVIPTLEFDDDWLRENRERSLVDIQIDAAKKAIAIVNTSDVIDATQKREFELSVRDSIARMSSSRDAARAKFTFFNDYRVLWRPRTAKE